MLDKITSDPETVEKMAAAGYKPLIYKGRKGFDENLKNYDALTTRIIQSAGLDKRKK